MNGDSSFAFASILAYMPRAEDDPREGFRKTSFYACVQYIRRHVPTRPLFLSFRFFVSLLVRGFISSFLFHSLSPFLVSLSLSLSLFLFLLVLVFSLSLSLSLFRSLDSVYEVAVAVGAAVCVGVMAPPRRLCR